MSDMRAALVAIQELHKPMEIEPSETICEECSTLRAGWYEPITEWPCPTRKLADEGLTDRMARTNQGENNE